MTNQKIANLKIPSLLFFFIFFLLSFVLNRAAAELNLKVHQVDNSQFPDLKVYLSLENNGKRVDSLNASDFNAIVDKDEKAAAQNILSLSDSQESIALVLAVDTSGSMRGKPLKAIKKSLKSLINKKAPKDVIALINFNDDVYKNCDFTSDTAELNKSVDSLKAGGKITVLAHVCFKVKVW